MNSSRERLRIVVLGYLIRGPLGGLAWHHLQYVAGLKELGHEVLFLEDSEDYASCYHPELDCMTKDATYGLRFASDAFARIGAGNDWAYHDAHVGQWHGPAAVRAVAFCRQADLLLNVSGVNPLRPWSMQVSRRVFVDTDPGFTQIRHLIDPAARSLADDHTHYFSFGENIGLRDCSVPDDGYFWKPSRQPVVSGLWPVTTGHAEGRFTTVMQWDSYAPREFNGLRLGMKSESFEPYWDLPALVGQPFELAVGSRSAPREQLTRSGWSVRDSREPTRDPWVYQAYLQQSKAEFAVAKHGYVVTGCGWFSERSAAYMACGRPVLVQDTGFSHWLPTGRGVLTFASLDEAREGVTEINRDYQRHCRAARDIAEEYFRPEVVLLPLIEDVMRQDGQPQLPKVSLPHVDG